VTILLPQRRKRRKGTPIPLQIGGLVCWYDASDSSTITDSSGAVSQWDDKGPGQFNLTQGTGANQPTTNATTMGGKNVITSDGGDFMDNASVPYNSTGTWVIVHRTDTLAANKSPFSLRVDADDNVEILAGDASSDGAFKHKGSTTDVRVTKADYAQDVDYILIADWDEGGDAINFFVNGNDEGTAGTLGTFTGTPTLHILGASASTSPAAQTGEFIYYDHVLSTAERDKIRNYLANKWGISA